MLQGDGLKKKTGTQSPQCMATSSHQSSRGISDLDRDINSSCAPLPYPSGDASLFKRHLWIIGEKNLQTKNTSGKEALMWNRILWRKVLILLCPLTPWFRIPPVRIRSMWVSIENVQTLAGSYNQQACYSSTGGTQQLPVKDLAQLSSERAYLW